MFSKFRHGHLLGNAALALALAVAGTGVAAPAHAADKKKEAAAPKMNFSKPFVAAAQPLEKAIEASKTRADVVAARAALDAANAAYNNARGSAARQAAMAQRTAALTQLGTALTPEKTMLEAAFAAAGNDDDKYLWGSLAARVGVVAQDLALIRRGYETSLATNKYAPADVPKVQAAVGRICFDQGDVACVRTQLGAAIAAGEHGDRNELLLADTYFKANDIPGGTDVLLKGIAARKAANATYGPEWYGTGLNAAFKAKALPQSAAISQAMVIDFPTPENWRSAIRVIRYLAGYQPQEMLDLLRLMKRTNTFEDTPDYTEYVDIADKLRFPAEIIEVVAAGQAAAKLDAGDPFVRDALAGAKLHEKEDNAGMAAMEARARSATATPAVIQAAADVLLSYGQSAKAEELLNLALTKPGLDAQRLLTRVGIAQFDQGKYADAQATFSKVTGPRQPMAQLWALYAAQKAKGG